MSLFNEIRAQNSILNAALVGTARRNEVIVNNIANIDVPGFRGRRVEFESSLEQAIGNYPHPLARRNLDLSEVAPTVHFQNPHMHYRLDGNNIDIEFEMVMLYQNSMKYDTLVSSVMANSQRMRSVLQQGV